MPSPPASACCPPKDRVAPDLVSQTLRAHLRSTQLDHGWVPRENRVPSDRSPNHFPILLKLLNLNFCAMASLKKHMKCRAAQA